MRDSGGFFIVYEMDDKNFVWIIEADYLYRRPSDSELDAVFLEKNRREFMDSTDTRKFKIDKCTYIVRFMYDCTEEHKKALIERFHYGQSIKLTIEDET